MPDPANEPGEDHVAAWMQAAAVSVAIQNSANSQDAFPSGKSFEEAIRSMNLAEFNGFGTLSTVRLLSLAVQRAATRTYGPRFFDFVTGGINPAALAADWLASAIDQNAAGPGTSAFATEVETLTIRSLIKILDLPLHWAGLLPGSAMLAALTGFGLARYRWASRNGVDINRAGLYELPQLPVLASDLVHPTSLKALQILGVGLTTSTWKTGDLTELERLLAGAPRGALVIATAGDTSLGRFDGIDAVSDVCRKYDAWLHVDAAIGLLSRLSPQTREYVRGIERVDSMSSDAHKMLNVPYECGIFLTSHPQILEEAFGMPRADYLESSGQFRGYSVLGPESSRRARSLPVWATLAAYGSIGLRQIVERLQDARNYLLDVMEEDGRFEVRRVQSFAIACFRLHSSPSTSPDVINQRLLSAIRGKGRFAVGQTRIQGELYLRVAIVNWRTNKDVIDELYEHIDTLVTDILCITGQ